MKKLYIVLLVFILVFNCVFADNPYLNPYYGIQTLENYSKQKVEESNNIYSGYEDYNKALREFNFLDVELKNKVYAQKLALLDISAGTDINKFSPNERLRNIEFLSLLLRANGNYNDLISEVKSENAGVIDKNLTKMINDKIIEKAKNSNIIDNNSSFDYYADVNIENFKKYVINAFSIVEKNGEINNYKKIDNIINNTVNISKNYITRIEFAKFFNDFMTEFSENTNVLTKKGYILGIKKYIENGIRYREYNILNEASNIDKIKLIDEKLSTSFVVLSNVLTDDKSLKIGDEIEYLIKDNIVKFAYKLSGDYVKNSIIDSYSKLSPLTVYDGTIKGIVKENIELPNENKSKVRISVELDNDKMVELSYEFDNINNIEDIFFIRKNGKIIKVNDLKNDDRISIFLKDDTLLYVAIGQDYVKYNSGNIKNIEFNEDRTAAKLSIFNFDDTISTYELDSTTSIFVNGYNVSMEEIKIGAMAELSAGNGKIINLYINSYKGQGGYVPLRGRIEYGIVENIIDNVVKMKDNENNKNYQFIRDSYTKFFKNSKEVSFGDLKKGDYLKLYYDDIYSKLPTRVEIEGKNQSVYRVIKGNIVNFNQFNDTITVSNIYDLKSAFWNKQNTPYQESFKIALDSQLYENSELFNNKLLNKEAVNREAYFVIKDNFGSKEIAKMVFKTGKEKKYSESIADYNQILNNLTLKDKKIFNYNSGSIFIEKNMLVSDRALRKDANIVIIGNTSQYEDELKIAVILEDHRNIFDNFYVAALEDVDPYWVTFKNYTHISDYEFVPISTENKRFSISDETIIFDVDKQVFLTPEKLFYGKYTRSENEDRFSLGLKFKRYYALSLIDDGHIDVMVLKKKGIFEDDYIDDKAKKEFEIPKYLSKSLENVNYTQGEVVSKIDKWKRVTLKNSYNYFNSVNEWKPNKSDTTVEITNTTLILKDSKLIKFEELKENDRCYIIRVGYKALFVLVK